MNSMETLVVLGSSDMGAGFLILLLGWFLKKNKVPRNRVVGIRTKQSLASDEAWYRINTYGGKKLILGGTLLVVLGATILGLRPNFPHSHLVLAFSPLVILAYPVIAILRFSAKNAQRP